MEEIRLGKETAKIRLEGERIEQFGGEMAIETHNESCETFYKEVTIKKEKFTFEEEVRFVLAQQDGFFDPFWVLEQTNNRIKKYFKNWTREEVMKEARNIRGEEFVEPRNEGGMKFSEYLKGDTQDFIVDDGDIDVPF